MFKTLLEKLSGETPRRLDPEDARVAVAALLVRIARADHDYAAAEIAQIDQILAQRFNVDAEAAALLRQEGETFEQAAPDTVRFTTAVKNGVPIEDRLSVVEAAWRVALSDGARADEEDALMRMIPRFLGVNDVDSAMARKRAEAALAATS